MFIAQHYRDFSEGLGEDRCEKTKLPLIVATAYYYFIYLFMTALGLHCCAWAGLSLRCGARASHYGGFSCGAWALGVRASVVVAHRLSSCGSWALKLRLSSCCAWA